ncbi:hypothetical protein NHQ30_005834 [Ciborinia camelliae]|nr:hypothetical protein NHQ30_005834 [Ciborinia camelliae]
MAINTIENKTFAMVSISPKGARSVLSGALFGAALTAAGVYSPTVIISQLKLESFHMLKVFLSASATSSLIFLLAHRVSPTLAPPRQPSSLSLFPYDGNLIGGLLIGIGMALTGACPGTVLPQVVNGYRSGPFVLLGCIIGGIIYSKSRPFIRRSQNAGVPIVKDPKPTLYQKLNPEADEFKAVYMYQNFCWCIVLLASWLDKSQVQSLVSPTLGGACIGAAQGASLLLTGNTLGTSLAYEQVGDLFWWAMERVGGGQVTSLKSTLVSKAKGYGNSIDHVKENGTKLENKNENKASKPQHPPRPSISSTLFVLGILLGSYALSRTLTLPSPLPKKYLGASSIIPEISIARALLGGTSMALGARIAGGCTSGHGISGMSLLSVSSIISVAAMFGGGIAWAVLVG